MYRSHHEFGGERRRRIVEPWCSSARRFSWIALAVALAVTTLERSAGATDNFPAVIERYWGLSLMQLVKSVGGQKGCLLCHSDESETMGKTVETPVGHWFKDNGLVKLQATTLQQLLVKNYNSKQDSDKDGVPDYAELVRGTNPNVPDRPSKPPPTHADAGSGGKAAVVDGGPVSTFDAASSSVAQPPPPPSQNLPPLLQTGCNVSHESTRGLSGVAACAVLAGLSLLRRHARRRLASENNVGQT
jgi:hypothetical protein